MTTRLRVVVDQLVAPVPGAVGRYTLDLTRALIETAPAGCEVAGIVSSSPPTDYEAIEAALPGLADLYRTSLARRELAAAWQVGLTTSPGSGMIHSPSLFAPLRKHDRANGNQVVVTVHDTMALTHPESLSAAEAAWRRAMLKRAGKHADAVVVSTHALANRLADHFDFGDRVRVISPARPVRTRDPGRRGASLRGARPPRRLPRDDRHPRTASWSGRCAGRTRTPGHAGPPPRRPRPE